MRITPAIAAAALVLCGIVGIAAALATAGYLERRHDAALARVCGRLRRLELPAAQGRDAATPRRPILRTIAREAGR